MNLNYFVQNCEKNGLLISTSQSLMTMPFVLPKQTNVHTPHEFNLFFLKTTQKMQIYISQIMHFRAS